MYWRGSKLPPVESCDSEKGSWPAVADGSLATKPNIESRDSDMG